MRLDTVEATDYCFRFPIGARVRHKARGIAGTVTEHHRQGIYAGRRYINFPTVMFRPDHLLGDQDGAWVEECELRPQLHGIYRYGEGGRLRKLAWDGQLTSSIDPPYTSIDPPLRIEPNQRVMVYFLGLPRAMLVGDPRGFARDLTYALYSATQRPT